MNELKAQVTFFSLRGTKEANQDSFLVDSIQSSTDSQVDTGRVQVQLNHRRFHVLAVADGVSNCSDGKDASACCIEKLKEQIELLNNISGEDLNKAVKDWLWNSFDAINEDLIGDYELFTTLSVFVWDEKTSNFYALNMGDSPILLIRNGKVIPLYKRHNMAGIKEDNGKRPEDRDEDRLVLYLGNKYLSIKNNREDLINGRPSSSGKLVMTTFQGVLRPHDHIIVATDGAMCLGAEWMKYSTDQLFSETKKIIKNKNVYVDNTTVISIDFSESGTLALENSFINADDFVSMLEQNKEELANYRAFVKKVKKKSKITDKKISQAMGKDYSVVTIRRYRTQTRPPKRESAIAFGIALNMDIVTLNEYLTRYCQFEELYPRRSADFIWYYLIDHEIFINQKGKQKEWYTIPEMYEHYYEHYKKIYNELANDMSSDSDLHKQSNHTLGTLGVKANIALEDDFAKLVRENIRDVNREFDRFVSLLPNINKVFPEFDFRRQNERRNFYRNITEKINNGIVPLRYDLIALAVWSGYDLDQINQLLLSANMEKLCARQPVEALIIYLMENTGNANVVRERVLEFNRDYPTIIDDYFSDSSSKRLLEKIEGSEYYSLDY